MNEKGIFSTTTLKLIACFLMVIDHVGMYLFPGYKIFRIVGRLSYPIFAFFIAEGCKYTKNKVKHLMLIMLLGIGMLLFNYYIFNNWTGCIFLTFTFSIIYIYIFDLIKDIGLTKVLKITIYLCILMPGYIIFKIINIDYGFIGMLIPVGIYIINYLSFAKKQILNLNTELLMKLGVLIIGLILISLNNPLGYIQFFSLLAIIPLLFYNGKPGIKHLKYFFYFFYPVHIVIIYMLYLII